MISKLLEMEPVTLADLSQVIAEHLKSMYNGKTADSFKHYRPNESAQVVHDGIAEMVALYLKSRGQSFSMHSRDFKCYNTNHFYQLRKAFFIVKEPGTAESPALLQVIPRNQLNSAIQDYLKKLVV